MRCIIDTDPGMGTTGTDPEDGLAILAALAWPGVEVEALTVVAGNVPVTHGWSNLRHLLDLAGHPEVPVHVGAAEPLHPDRRPLQVAWLAQREGMPRTAPLVEPPAPTAAEAIVELVRSAPGEITLVAIGPLTNVAAALEADPGVADDLAGLVVMGGTVAVPGNITPAAEFNLWMDPDAADLVLRSGAPITMVGLDVCHRTHLDRGAAQQVRAAGTPLATFVADAADSWMDVRRLLFPDEEALHLYDTLAVAAAVEPDLLSCRRALVEVETSTGPAQGMTVTHTNDVLRQLVAGGREPNASVAVDVDVDRFAAAFAERVLAPLGS